MRDFLSRSNLIGLALLLLSSGAAPAQPQDKEAADRLRSASQRLVQAMAQEVARQPYDVHGQASRLGFDVERMYAFVQEDLRFEPYVGFQRGPAGVLAAESGNSADKAHLLRELLRVGGQEARVVSGKLDGAAAKSLLDRALRELRERKIRRDYRTGEVDAKDLAATCGDLGLSSQELEPILRGAARSRRTMWQEVADLTVREAAFLQGKIDAASWKPKDRKIHDELSEAVRTHYWVQWQKGGTWVDLDPSFDGFKIGQSATKVQTVVENPSALADRYVIHLQAERQVGDKREKVTLLRYDAPLQDAISRPLRLSIQPTKWNPDPAEKLTEEEIYQKLAAFTQFQAVLTVGEERLGSQVFDYDGTVSELKGDGQIEALQDLAKGIGGHLGDPFEGGGDKQPKTTLTGLWVDFHVVRGRDALWGQRRAILEEEKRATWCPILTWNLFFQNHEFSREFVRHKNLETRVRNDGFIRDAKAWAAGGDFGAVRKAEPAYYPLDLLDFAVARQAFRGGAESPTLLYFDRPNLFLSGQQARLHPGPKSVCLCAGIDLVENGAWVVEGGDAFALNRRATTALGVFDTVLESVLVRQANESEAVMGAVGFFERARVLSKSIRFVGSREATGLPESDARWIRENMAADEFVLVAEVAGEDTVAWWAYRPATGQAVGRISGGKGGTEVRQTMAEYIYQTINWINIGLCVFGIIKYAYKAVKGSGQAAAILFAKVIVCSIMTGLGHEVHHFAQHSKLAADMFAAIMVELIDLMIGLTWTFGG